MNNMKKLHLLSILILSIGLVAFLSGCTTDIKPAEDKPIVQESEKINTNPIDDQDINNDTNAIADQTFSIKEVNKHSSRNDCWMTIEGKVYNVTEYVLSGKHKPVIVEGCGIDATDIFNQEKKHSKEKDKVDKLFNIYYIGNLK